MDQKNSQTIVIAMILLCGVFASGIDAGSATQEATVEEVVTDIDGIVYEISFDKNQSIVVISATNPTERDGDHTGYNIRVDDQRVYDTDFKLSKNERRTEKINITPGINVNQDEHTITFSTYGNSTQFNFTREIDSSDSGPVPTPHISNVEVTNGSIKGEPSAVANVTIVNPSEQLYSTKLMVHTVGTDGSLYPASVRPGDSRTITVELLDERGAEIAGEARLYTGNMTTREGAIDQVEFAGQAGEETSVWTVSYESARPTWMDDNYEYENASYERSLDEKLSRGHDVAGVPLVYPAVALLVGALVVRKFR